MHPTRHSKSRYALVLGFIFFIYLLDNPFLFDTVGIGRSFNSLLKPLLWMGLALMIWRYPAVRPVGKLKTRGSLNFWAFTLAVIIIAIQFLAGLIDGLGKSPYDHSLTGMMSNTLMIGTVLVGRELARSYLVNSLTRVENYKVFIPVTLLMTLMAFPMAKFTSFTSYEEIAKFMAQFLIPEFSKNLLATVLVFYGGAASSIIFMVVIEAFQWFSPILPNLKWITAALVGILTPVFLLTAVEIIYEDEAKIRKRKSKGEENPLSWILTTLVSIGIVWFSVGVFSVYPSVIATGSMIPMIQPGDIILVNKKVDTNHLQTGEVIQFKRDDILISHRILDIVADEKQGTISYKTKGDNNSGADSELVKPTDVKGEVVKVIPKLGWPTLLMKSKKDVPLDKIEF